jgi:hypothetical protein
MHVIILIAFDYFPNVPLVYRVGVQLNHRGSAFIKEIYLINVTNFWIKFLSPPHPLLSKPPLIGWNLKVAAPVPLVQSRQPFGGQPCGPYAPDDGRGGGRGGGRREEEEDEPNQSAGTINLVTTTTATLKLQSSEIQ